MDRYFVIGNIYDEPFFVTDDDGMVKVFESLKEAEEIASDCPDSKVIKL